LKALIGRKLGMTQIIQEDGTVAGVTLVQAGPCAVTQLRNLEVDGYEAVQIGFEENSKIPKPQAGHAKAANISPAVMREIRDVDYDKEATKVGSSFNVTEFEVGDRVNVVGVSKGKGWAGTIKRHNFSRSRKTHGGNGAVRRPGSIGSMYPQKVFKGKKMAGRMGGEQVTTSGLKISLVDAENNVLGIQGAVPGPKRSIVIIKGAK
jgi:large subunit ribosomal protein L3